MGRSVLVTGGSQGASVLCQVVPDGLAMLPVTFRRRLRVLDEPRRRPDTEFVQQHHGNGQSQLRHHIGRRDDGGDHKRDHDEIAAELAQLLHADHAHAGQLLKTSGYEFRYRPGQHGVAGFSDAPKLVDGVDQAIAHIRRYGSQHTESILTENDATAERFFQRLDSAILMRNASTQFADGGEFGLGELRGLLVDLLRRGSEGRAALERVDELPDDPQVTANGFPFLTQAASGTYERVEVSAVGLPVGLPVAAEASSTLQT